MEINDEIWKITVNNANYRKIANYIIHKFNKKLEVEEAKDIAEGLMNIDGCSVEDILRGNKDELIKKRLAIKKSQSKSTKNNLFPEIAFKTKKKKVNVPKMILALTSAVAIAGAISYGVASDYKLEVNVSDYLGLLAATPGTIEYDYGMSIVNQNKIPTYNDEVTSYDYSKIAMDIVDICIKDPELFEVTLSDVYLDVENKLHSMDEIITFLKKYTSSDESLQSIYAKIQDCDVFLDYLMTRGLINQNEDIYYLLQRDIEDYKSLKNGNNIAYNGLSDEAKSRIDELTKRYREQKQVLNELHVNRLENLVNEQGEEYGTRT